MNVCVVMSPTMVVEVVMSDCLYYPDLCREFVAVVGAVVATAHDVVSVAPVRQVAVDYAGKLHACDVVVVGRGDTRHRYY